MSPETEQHLISLIARLALINGSLERIEHDLRYQTETLTEAIYTFAAMQATAQAGTTPSLFEVNKTIHTWLEAKYREEHPIT